MLIKQEVLWCAKPKPTHTDFISTASRCRKSPPMHIVASHSEETYTSSHKRSRVITPPWPEPASHERKDVSEQNRNKRGSLPKYFWSETFWSEASWNTTFLEPFRSINYYRLYQTQGGLRLFAIGVFGVSQLQPVMVSWLEPVWDDQSLAGVFAAPAYLDPEEAVPNGRDLVLLYWLAPVQQILHPLNKISLLGGSTKAGLPSHQLIKVKLL